VEPDKRKDDFASVAVDISLEDLEIVGNQIETAWAGIQALDFNRGCQEANCRWCNFEKNKYRLLPAFTEEDEEEALLV
jgi:hypothetical protein